MFGWLFGSQHDSHEEAGIEDGQRTIEAWEELGDEYTSQDDAAKWIAWNTAVDLDEVYSQNASPEHKSYLGGFLKGLLG